MTTPSISSPDRRSSVSNRVALALGAAVTMRLSHKRELVLRFDTRCNQNGLPSFTSLYQARQSLTICLSRSGLHLTGQLLLQDKGEVLSFTFNSDLVRAIVHKTNRRAKQTNRGIGTVQERKPAHLAWSTCCGVPAWRYPCRLLENWQAKDLTRMSRMVSNCRPRREMP